MEGSGMRRTKATPAALFPGALPVWYLKAGGPADRCGWDGRQGIFQRSTRNGEQWPAPISKVTTGVLFWSE